MNLIWRGHMRIEHFFGNRYQARMSHPGTITAVGHFTQLVGAYFFHRRFIGCRIILDRDLCGHAAHRKRLTLMAGLHEREGIRAQERCHHRHLTAVSQAEVLVQAEFLDR